MAGLLPSALTRPGGVNPSDPTDFPSLGSPVAPASQPPKNAAWGADSGPRIKATIRSQPMVSDSFTLSVIELAANRDGKPTSLGEVMKQTMLKFNIKIEASANQRTRQTTFHMKSESQKVLDKAKRSLLALLSPVVRPFAAPFESPWNAVSGYPHPTCSRFYYSSDHRIQRSVNICLSFQHPKRSYRRYSEASAGANWSMGGGSS